ncbi:uncharacterized protein RBU47_016491 [Passerculus sandwichensis]
MGMAGHRGTMWLLPTVLLFLQMRQTGISELKWRLVTPAEHSQSVFSVMDRGSLLSAGNICFRVSKVTGITANPDAHPENEGSAEALSRQLEVTREAGVHPACPHGRW